MLLRLFRGIGPEVIFLIFITLILIWASAFLTPHISSYSLYDVNPMPLYGLLKTIIVNNHLAGVILSFLLVLLNAFLLVNFNTSVFFLNERTYLPAVFYVLFSGLFPRCQLLNPVLPAVVFLMLALRKIMDGYRKTGTAFGFFDAGFLISTGSLFYADLVWFGLLVIIGIALLRTGNFKEIAISVLGLVTPYILVFSLYYIIGKDTGSLLSVVGNNLFSKSAGYNYTSLTIVVLIYTGLITLASLVHLFSKMNAQKIKSRKTFSILIWVFIISLVLFAMMQSVSAEIVWITAIPISYFLTHYFLLIKKKIIPEILFSVLFILIFLIQVSYIK